MSLTQESTTGDSVRLTDLPAAFWWLWLSMLINRMGNFVVPFLTLYLTADRGYSMGLAGLVAALSGVGGMLGSLAGGGAADRFGRRPVLFAGHAAAAAALIGVGFCAQIVLLALSALLAGFFSAAARPAVSAMTADLLPPELRVRAYALNYWAMNLGFASSVVLAGAAAQIGYHLLFLADAATTLLCAVVIVLRVPESRHPRSPAVDERDARGPASSWASMLQNRSFLLCVVLFASLGAVLQQLTVTLPVSMVSAGFSPTLCGAVLSFNGILICLFQIPVSGLLTRRQPFAMLVLAALLCAAGFGLTGLAHSALGYAATIAVWTCGEMISGPMSTEVTARVATQHNQGLYQGVTAFGWTAGGVVASAFGGWFYGAFGNSALWTMCALVGVGAAVGFAVLGGRRGMAWTPASESA